MHCQLYISGRLIANPELGQTKKGRPWVKLILETSLIRETRPSEVQTESVILPISLFSAPADQVKALQKGDYLSLGCHLFGTEFRNNDGTVKHGVQIIADVVFLPQRKEVNNA